MSVVLTNNASSRLAVALTAGATSFSVSTGEGAKFPAISSGSGAWFPITLIKASGALEIVRCTARSGDVFTVTRAQEGTAAQAFSAGDRAELRLTAAAVNAFVQDDDVSAYIQTLLPAADEAAAQAILGLGNAATRTVQSGQSDATAGRILLTGAFGLGATDGVLVTDCNNATSGGFYRYSAATTNAPLATLGLLLALPLGGGVAQLAIDRATQRVFVRSITSTAPVTWSAWKELAYDALFSTLGKSLVAAADAGAVRTLLELGTAAIAAITTSSSDFTLGRLIKNGDKQACSAMVNFSGVGTVSIRDSFNVSSITDNGVGDYTINFQTALPNTLYSYVSASSRGATIASSSCVFGYGTPRTTGFDIGHRDLSNAAQDATHINLAVFGGRG